MTIAERVAMLLKQQQKTQAALAESLGLAASSVNYWVKKNSNIPADFIMQICKFLDVSPEYLLTGEEAKPEIVEAQPSPVGEKLEDDEAELIKIYRNLDREGRTMVLATAYQHRTRMAAAGEQAIGVKFA